MRWWPVAVFSMAFLLGCAAVPDFGAHETTCRERTDTFTALVECVVSEVKADPKAAGQDSDLTDLYVAYVDALADKVENGLVSEADAKLEMVILRMKLQEEAKSRTSMRLQRFGYGLQKMGQGLQQMEGTYPTGYPNSTIPEHHTFILPSGMVNCVTANGVTHCF